MDIREKLEAKLKKTNFSSLSDEQIKAINNILSSPTSEIKIKPKTKNPKGELIFDNIFLNKFIGHNPSTILICDSKSKIIKENKAAKNIFNTSLEEIYLFDCPIFNALDLKNKVEKIKQGNIESFPSFWFNPKHYFPEAPSKDICISPTLYTILDKKGKITNYVMLIIDINEREKAGKALIKSEEKYRQIFENIQTIYYETDLGGKILEISPSVENFTLYKRNELLGNNITEMYANPSDRIKFVKEIFEKGKVTNFNLTFKNKDNSIIYTTVNSKLLKNSNGVPEKVVGAILNISELILTINALKKSEERFREIYENTNDIIYTMDFQGNFITVNPCAEKILGYKFDEIENRNLSDYISSESAKIAFDNIRKKLIGEKKHTVYEVDFINRDGSLTSLEINSMVRYKEGKPFELFGIARNINERKEINEALRKSEEKYRMIFENAPLGIMTADIDGNIIEINPTLLQLLGSESIEEAKKINLLNFQPLVEFGSNESFKKCIETGKSIITETTYTSILGKTLNAKVYIKPFNITNGKVTSFQVIVQNITEEKLAEQKLKSTLAEKEILLREIHHRVKNNMQIIISLINMQMQDIGDELMIRKYKELQQRVRTMSTIHEDLYISDDLSKINFGKYLLKLSNNLRNLYLNKNKIELKYNLADIFFSIDIAIPFGLIVNELLSNSFKHAFPDEKFKSQKYKKCKVNIEFTPAGNKYLLIVEDNGIGMPDNFEEIKENTLGLMLVYILVGQLKGTIKMIDRNGVRFEIEIEKEIK